MSQRQKLLYQLLGAKSDSNIDFASLCNLLQSLGFAERVRGSHHIYTKTGIEEIINLQPVAGCKVKPYQAKQVRELIVRYQLVGDDQHRPAS